jgi:anthranilate/para-aminobenzoate synthase component II
LVVTASTDQGEVMGLQHRTAPLYGVQFHPESVLTPNGIQVLENFLHVPSGPVPVSARPMALTAWEH